jgi:hypothetical protein
LKLETSYFLLLHRNFTLVAELVDLPAGRQARKVEGLVFIIKFIKNIQLFFLRSQNLLTAQEIIDLLKGRMNLHEQKS